MLFRLLEHYKKETERKTPQGIETKNAGKTTSVSTSTLALRVVNISPFPQSQDTAVSRWGLNHPVKGDVHFRI